MKDLHPVIVIREQLDAVHPIISCSSVHIKKVVMNLMTNAIEAIDNRGNVLISTCHLKIT